jgi:hypothetical protein
MLYFPVTDVKVQIAMIPGIIGARKSLGWLPFGLQVNSDILDYISNDSYYK